MQDSKGKVHFTFKGVRLCGCLFLFCIWTCTTKKNQLTPALKQRIESVCKTGDIIVRNGNDAISNAAREFNRKDKTHSHCGLVLIEHDSVFVYHALGGTYNPSQRLMRQTLEAFCESSDIDKIAIFRYPLNSKQEVDLCRWVDLRYNEGLPFDLFFNFYSDDRMYCSEFVFKALNEVMHGGLTLPMSTNDELPYVTIDDLYLNDNVRQLLSIDLKKGVFK